MSWKVGQAKQRFSEVLRRARRAPQLIENRDELVAAVVGRKDLEEFLSWKERMSLAVALDELQAVAGEEDYVLEAHPRQDRATVFGAARRPAKKRQ